nr:uncharacterized protein LOC102135148 [Macaca fascicularis]
MWLASPVWALPTEKIVTYSSTQHPGESVTYLGSTHSCENNSHSCTQPIGRILTLIDTFRATGWIMALRPGFRTQGSAASWEGSWRGGGGARRPRSPKVGGAGEFRETQTGHASPSKDPPSSSAGFRGWGSFVPPVPERTWELSARGESEDRDTRPAACSTWPWPWWRHRLGAPEPGEARVTGVAAGGEPDTPGAWLGKRLRVRATARACWSSNARQASIVLLWSWMGWMAAQNHLQMPSKQIQKRNVDIALEKIPCWPAGK